jgi:hypothetical protein
MVGMYGNLFVMGAGTYACCLLGQNHFVLDSSKVSYFKVKQSENALEHVIYLKSFGGTLTLHDGQETNQLELGQMLVLDCQ